jgi:hypothetical protein
MFAVRLLAVHIAHLLRPQFYFGTTSGPEWDFTSVTGNPNDFVIGTRVGSIPDPTGDPAFNIDWLALNAVEGQLASQIFRVDTVGGQPPASVRLSIAPTVAWVMIRFGSYSAWRATLISRLNSRPSIICSSAAGLVPRPYRSPNFVPHHTSQWIG